MKMNEEQMSIFLKALDAVRDDYRCAVCSELCNKPVTLKTCRHLICAEHLEDLRRCPACKTPLLDSPVFTDDGLEACVNSVKELNEMFLPFRTTLGPLQTSDADNAVDKKKSRKKIGASKAIDKSKGKLITDDKRITRRDNVNSSFLSTASTSKINKPLCKRNFKGETPLHVSCRLGLIDKVKELLEMGANPNSQDNAGWTPLHEVVQSGRLDLVKLLIQYKALINVPGPGNETPLHEAVRYNYKEIVEELVTHGADLCVRNSKGETPLDIASDLIKNVLEMAAENIIQTQTANVLLATEMQSDLEFKECRIYSVSHSRSVNYKLKVLVKHHDNVHIELNLSKKVTHIIVDTDDDRICTTSLDVLQGIVSGVWILSSKWVMISTKEELKPFHDYEVLGVGTATHNGPRNSRHNKYKQLPGLFNGCHFYLHNFNVKYQMTKTLILDKTVLSKLITDAGGVVLRRVPNPELIPEMERLVPYHAKKGGKLQICSHYIIFKDIYEPMYNMKHFKALPIGWLIECMEKYELIEPE